MILDLAQVLEIIPQKNPFVMVSTLESASEKELTTTFTIEENNVLNENGEFSTPGLIENIAQSCAAGFGYLARKANAAPKIGFIGSVSKLNAYSNPKIGDTIKTEITVITVFENITMIKGTNYLNETKLVECEMKIVITD